MDSGWERAVETVLGSYLEAVCVDSIDDVAAMLSGLASGAVSFFAGARVPSSETAAPHLLRTRVAGPAGIDAFRRSAGFRLTGDQR